MANELRAARKWLATTLEDDAAVAALVSTRIYAGMAPQEATYPLVEFNLNSASDVEAAGADRRVMSTLRFTVKAITVGNSFVAADEIAAAVDAALVGPGGTVAVGSDTYRVLGCGREHPLEFAEADAGIVYRHVGGVYRLDVHLLP